MAAFNKFQDTVEQFFRGVHNFSAHTFKIALANVAPLPTNTILANITQIAAGGGYVAGGYTLTGVTLTEAAGTAKVSINDLTITAVGGPIGPFRYLIIYNDTATSPADAVVGWYDYGASLTLSIGESLTIDFDGANGVFTLT